MPLIAVAATEDLADGVDLTASLLLEPNRIVSAAIVQRQPGVACGRHVAAAVCAFFSQHLRRPLSFAPAADAFDDGAAQAVTPAGTVFGHLVGQHAAVLTAERTVLNFLARLGGVATLTRRFVDAAAASPRVRIYDTRKTIPAWRTLDKYAVRCGGGHNHRLGLHDAVLIKDNHIAGVPPEQLADRLRAMLAELADAPQRPAFVEVEVDSLEQLDAALTVPGVDIILLDNFEPPAMTEAVRRRNAASGDRPVELEASGGVTLDTVASIAATGVDRIAVGALTHSAPALDLALDL